MFKKSTIGVAAAALMAATNVAQAESNLLFILDSSGSMWGQVDGVAKITTAKTALNRLMGDLPPNTKAGLMVYGHREKGWCEDVELLAPLGRAQSGATANALNSISPKGKTPIAYSLGQSKFAFEGTSKDANNNVVLISDGIETCGGDPCAVAAELASQNVNVKVHVVGFDIPDEDRKQLECIADRGKGKYFAANSTEGFTEAVSEAVKIVVAEPEPEPEPAPPPKPEPTGPLFIDEFDGDSLSGNWEVLNEDPDSYIVEDGKLLIIGTNAGHLNKAPVPNIIRFKNKLPKGDWVATIKFSVPYQTGKEAPFLGIYQDQDNHIVGSTYSNSYYGGVRGAQVFLGSWKRSKAKQTSFSKVIWGGAKGVAYTEEQSPNPILLKITKRGRKYAAAYKLEGMKQSDWVEQEELTSLKPKGNLAFGIFQHQKVNGETPMSIDWFKIEKLN